MSTEQNQSNKQFDHFYIEHHSWLISWIRSRLNSSEQALDLAQDTFLKVLVNNSSSQLYKPRAYLSSIARGLIINAFRRRNVEQAYLDSLRMQQQVVHMSPEQRESIIDTLVEVDRLLDNLGIRGRQIFLMSQIDGLSYVEIGRQLHISTNTVRKYFIRAMTQCLALIDD
ncbi:MAG: RNA polymerase subunit sigma [Gammaproteobacteria bacterium]|nr:MAG: RNA polymerase subunit sigma [Gammaproteobacteria bacterium]